MVFSIQSVDPTTGETLYFSTPHFGYKCEGDMPASTHSFVFSLWHNKGAPGKIFTSSKQSLPGREFSKQRGGLVMFRNQAEGLRRQLSGLNSCIRVSTSSSETRSRFLYCLRCFFKCIPYFVYSNQDECKFLVGELPNSGSQASFL